MKATKRSHPITRRHRLQASNAYLFVKNARRGFVPRQISATVFPAMRMTTAIPVNLFYSSVISNLHIWYIVYRISIRN